MITSNIYSDNLKQLANNIRLNNIKEIRDVISNITRILNKNYYNANDNKTHMYIVGSVGRGTAVKSDSDLDILFDLPKEIFTKYNSYESNGQSALLQEVKNTIKQTYSRTDIKGDGQVVVIEFDTHNFVIELVPGFKQIDNTFKYPDTHNDGSWKITNPFDEQLAADNRNDLSFGKYYDFCKIIRCWKNNKDFKLNGLLIDTLVNNCFEKNCDFTNNGNYLLILISLFEFISKEDSNQKYWLALGSNQHIDNGDDCDFIKKAKNAYESIQDGISNDSIDIVLNDLFGNEYPLNDNSKINRDLGEEFIEDYFSVKVKYGMNITCILSQNGFMPRSLNELLQIPNYKITNHYGLNFKANIHDNIHGKYSVYWKVKNNGNVARERNCLRGKVVKTNSLTRKETSDFYGNHYVEYYIVQDNVCVARAHLDVPIGNIYFKK